MTNLSVTTNDQLQILKDFANAENKQLVDELEEILQDVAKTGQYIYPWHFMKPLYACKLELVTSEFLATSPPIKIDGTEDKEEIEKLRDFRENLLRHFDKFVCAPFTIQRMSEMLTEPRKHYKSTGKFFRGLEKNILVVSTIDPVPAEQRPLLKRSFYDENPIEKQNGYVDTALKPQLKKIHLEENVEEHQISVESSVCNDQLNTKEKVANDCPFSDSKTNPNSDTTDHVEEMLLCSESVGVNFVDSSANNATTESGEPKYTTGNIDNNQQESEVISEVNNL